MTGRSHRGPIGPAHSAPTPIRRRRKFDPRARSVRGLGIVLIVLWCLAPFYWMVVRVAAPGRLHLRLGRRTRST